MCLTVSQVTGQGRGGWSGLRTLVKLGVRRGLAREFRVCLAGSCRGGALGGTAQDIVLGSHMAASSPPNTLAEI